ncbi:WD40 repeat domain-containing protein [Endozoicomonas sp. ISHI1]|uniref:WD40 repeat domain-containing protein n=1 Tax=Endozoicomonas sp. ISHI1 TaxID=2825882 RepID=UPI0021495093|nr:WD40 repeat domain-containing protein [Endozoicomonas sp. ISHI1]
MTPGIKQINDNSNIVDSPGQPQSEQTTATGMGREITASYQCESLLKELPKEVKYKVIDYLDLPTVTLLKRTCSELCDVIEEGDVLAKAWYKRFSSAHQAQLEAVISTKDKNQLREWMGRFTNDKALIKSLLERRESDQFPAIFYFTISRLMSECKAFELVEQGEISHGGIGIESATFSADGRHVVTKTITVGHNIAKISGQDISGSWDVKANIVHTGLINSATFSPDCNHLVTASDDHTARIYGYSADGSWKEKVTITHDHMVSSATFSPDSTLVVTASYDRTAKIYGLEANGSWVPKARISHEGSILSATFSADGRYVITGSADKVKIHGQEDDGSWLETGSIPNDSHVTFAAFSIDGTHVLTIGKMLDNDPLMLPFSSLDFDCTVKIYNQKADGSWEPKLGIHHFSWVISASLSPDSSHTVTASIGGTVKICGQKADGSWELKAIIRHKGLLTSATFSADGRYLVTASQDKTVKIYGLKAGGIWIEEASIAHDGEVNSAVFSADGRHVVTASKDKTAKIIGQQIDGSWVVKASISHQDEVNSATFSADCCHVLTASEDGTAKIIEIRGSLVSPEPAQAGSD